MSAKVLAILSTIVDLETIVETLNVMKTSYVLSSMEKILLTIPNARDRHNAPMFEFDANKKSYNFSYDDMDKAVCEAWKERFLSVYETVNVERTNRLRKEAIMKQAETLMNQLKMKKFNSQMSQNGDIITITAIRN